MNAESGMAEVGIESESELVRLAVDLGAEQVGGELSAAERRLLKAARSLRPSTAAAEARAREAITGGADPLGTAFCALRNSDRRRETGAFFTPRAVVGPMLEWALGRDPARMVDPGCGSGRFAVSAVRMRPDLEVVAVDLDPVATLLTRAALSVVGAKRARVLHRDYTTLELSPARGRTAYVGNPPYVRHHRLPARAKQWAARAAAQLGLRVSGLAGLHAHFYLATAALVTEGDVGCFVTSAEWLDVNYGALVRDLLAGPLGARSIHALEEAGGRGVFEDAMTTAVIACFEVGSKSRYVRFRRVAGAASLANLDTRAATSVARGQAARAARWSPLLDRRRVRRDRTETVPLRAVARVHRGVATGANSFFVLTRARAESLGIARFCRPVISGARQILESRGEVRDGPAQRVLLAVPAEIDRAAHPRLDEYLRSGEEPTCGEPVVAERYLPSHRRPWWYLGTLEAPPIVASYMARQPPRFATNPDHLAILNIAHGVYPNTPLSAAQLTALVAALNRSRPSYAGAGRTYAGGLEKFEPREMERLELPATGPWS